MAGKSAVLKRKTIARKNYESEDTDSLSSSSIDSEAGDSDRNSSTSEEELETPAEKRLRLAKTYLETIKPKNEDHELADGEFLAEELDNDLIHTRLMTDVAENKGIMYNYISDTLDFNKINSRIVKLPIGKGMTTSIVQDTNGNFYIGTKSGIIFQINEKMKIISSRKDRDQKHKAHSDAILKLAISDDGRFLVSAGKDKTILVFDLSNKKIKAIAQLKHHRDAVNCVAFRHNSHELYSCSSDRAVKVWNIDLLSYIQTLYGHQDDITCIDGFLNDKCITVGCRDRSVRIWKIEEESQLVFRGQGSTGLDSSKKKYIEGSIDTVALVDEDTFLSGSDNGDLSLWTTKRKKPIFTIQAAHGLQKPIPPFLSSAERHITESSYETPAPIISVKSIFLSDIFFSGSKCGHLNIWKISQDKKSFSLIKEIKINGFINDISARIHDNKLLKIVLAISPEPRLGRWEVLHKVMNGLYSLEIPIKN